MELLSIILIIASLLPFSAPDLQADALYDMKLKLNATSSQLSDWDQNQVNPCAWSSVICDSNNNVVQVALDPMGFTGLLSPRIGDLEYLNVLSLPGNEITGGIPEEFGNLSRLTSLNLEDNLLAGPIPASLGKLSKLELLILSRNILHGSIPDTLASISSLSDIRLASNKLTGQIPPQLFQVARYDFSDNNLTCGTYYEVRFPHPCTAYRVPKKNNLAKILLPIIAFMLLLTSALVWTCKYKAGKRHKKEVQKRMVLEYLSSTNKDGDKNIEFPFITFKDIIVATDNFSDSNMIGKGGFGKVYKGMVEGTKEVAVKRLSKGSGQGTEEFINEVGLIAKLQHKNLVKLLGCCIHGDERLLVYEYLPNKSLDYFLFDSTRKTMLQWPTRCKIIQGVARGILYLHQDSRLTIIHRDLKASNILLDKEMKPKISDFGMARIFCGDQHQANTNRVVGTYGYMSPEYAMEGAFSFKSDIYSFGVLVLEIVTGLKISSPHLIMDFPNLIVYAWNLWKNDKTEDLVDSFVKENCTLDEVSRCIHIGLLCVQDSPSSRPLMSEVVSMLENKTMQLPIPMQPVYFARRDAERGRGVSNLSLNDLSLTELGGR